jgi:PST family polysaccharide transporter/lipopolysaccharide exporter
MATTLPLVARVRSGISWNVTSSLVGQFIGFVRSVTLARLLAPKDFGLFAMALTIVAAANALTTIGSDRTIIANKFETRDELKAHLDTVWSAELIRRIIVTLLVSLSAVPIARFYRQSELKAIIPLMACAGLVQGFQNIGLVLLQKEINFERVFWFDLAVNLGGALLTIALAAVMQNVWALVFGMLLTTTMGTALSYVFHPFRPRVKFERVALIQASHFAKFAIVFAVASYVSNMADNVMVGRLLGTAALGNYSLAFNIASAPIIIVFSVSAVLLPAYAEINTQKPAMLQAALTKSFNITLIILLTVAVPVFFFANEIVQLLFGARWTSAGSVLRILALVIPLRGLTMLTSTVFWSTNRAREVALVRVLDAVVFLAALYPLVSRAGLPGVAWAGVIAYAFACVNRTIALNKMMPGISSKLLRSLFAMLVLLIMMLLVRGLVNR